MTDKAFERAQKIKCTIAELNGAIEFLENNLDGQITSIRFNNTAFWPDKSPYCAMLLMSEAHFETEDNKRLVNHILTALKDERDILEIEYEEL